VSYRNLFLLTTALHFINRFYTSAHSRTHQEITESFLHVVYNHHWIKRAANAANTFTCVSSICWRLFTWWEQLLLSHPYDIQRESENCTPL